LLEISIVLPSFWTLTPTTVDDASTLFPYESKQKKESMQGVPAMTLFELMLTFEMQELTDAGTIVKMETFLDSGTDLVPSKIKSAISDLNNTTTETPNL
jgi:hypothetical protein